MKGARTWQQGGRCVNGSRRREGQGRAHCPTEEPRPRQLMVSTSESHTPVPVSRVPGGRPGPSSFLSDHQALHGVHLPGVTLDQAARWEARLRFRPSAVGFRSEAIVCAGRPAVSRSAASLGHFGRRTVVWGPRGNPRPRLTAEELQNVTHSLVAVSASSRMCVPGRGLDELARGNGPGRDFVRPPVSPRGPPSLRSSRSFLPFQKLLTSSQGTVPASPACCVVWT